MREWVISTDDSSQRLDKYLRRLFPQAAGGFLYRMLRKKNITLNEKKASGSERLSEGDIVRVWFSDETIQKLSGEDEAACEYEKMRLKSSEVSVIYEDVDMIFIDKPAGLLSQKAAKEDDSLNDRLRSYLIKNGLSLSEYKAYKPSVANRLDFGTSGVVACAKTISGARHLSEWIRGHKLKKLYVALVHGHFRSNGRVVSFLEKNEKTNQVFIKEKYTKGASRIETEFSLIRDCNSSSLVLAELITGKSHQIRAQLQALGHPVVLDAKYGDRKADLRIKKAVSYPGQLLHAQRLILPDNREIVSRVPQIFYRVLEMV